MRKKNKQSKNENQKKKKKVVELMKYIKIYFSLKGHNATVNSVTVLMDSRRIISADRDGLLCVWLADSATLLQTIQGPYKSLAATNNMKFAVSNLVSNKNIKKKSRNIIKNHNNNKRKTI